MISLLPACASMKSNYSSRDADLAIQAAEAAQAKASKLGYEWRDTDSLIHEAMAAATAQDFNKAVALASQAENQGIAAVKQYHLEMSVFD